MSIEVLDLTYADYAEIESHLHHDVISIYIRGYNNPDMRIVRSADGNTIVQSVKGHGSIGEPLWERITHTELLALIFKIAMYKVAAGKKFTTVTERVRYCSRCECVEKPLEKDSQK